MNTQTTLKAALLLTILAMLTACGSQKADEPSTDQASRAPETTVSSKPSVVYCNQKSQGGITAKVMVYTDGSNQIRNDYMKVKFTQMPASFGTGDYIQFFRWQANSSNQIYVDPTPVQARFESLSGAALTNFSPVIYWGQVSALANNAGLSDVNAFLQKVRLVIDIRDPQAQFDVLKVAMYDGTSNANTVNMDILMPAFSASPTDYAKDTGGGARPATLQALHPFASMINQSWTADQYQSLAASYCF